MFLKRILLVLLLCIGVPASAAPVVVPTDGFNLTITKATATDVTTTPATQGYAHNWFAGRFAGLVTSQEATIRVDMKGNDTIGNKANVNKWRGLRPFYTYADPNQYDAYVGYSRDAQGRWISNDPFKTGKARYAGNGTVPMQRVISPALAPQFLSEDGTSWFPWQEIETAQPGRGNTFVIRHTFALPSASVVMRVPFTYTYWQQFVERLHAANLPGVHVDEVGETSRKRKLWCIRLEDPTGTGLCSRLI